VLEKRGCEVTVAENGQAAVNACATQRFDLILMDIQMPGMDGLEATAAIRKKEIATAAHMPIIAMTAHAWKEIRNAASRQGWMVTSPSPSAPSNYSPPLKMRCRVAPRQRQLHRHPIYTPTSTSPCLMKVSTQKFSPSTLNDALHQKYV
jgi:CheY-like chemotaxis protein